ncbi:EF-hand protein [Phanerochaete sordida]|uniref:EF-hand protein n=1 Tax=Phanerochaete sordida TaxID=48140 RepID=A0A9P3G2R4_9APHY|nr:EF-hand protein [Phanerochaete sordida]
MPKSRIFGRSAPQPDATQYAPPSGPPPNWPRWQTPSLGRSRDSRRGGDAPTANAPVVITLQDEIKRAFKACKTGKGNAQLLQETLAYTKAEDLNGNPLIKEFVQRCRASQDWLSSNIPWASFHAERSRETHDDTGETEEERLLAELLQANQELLDALKSYSDLEAQTERDRKKGERRLRALEAITSFNPTTSETALVDRIFTVGDPQNTGSIAPDLAHSILAGCRLPADTLQEIWDIANAEENATYGRYVVGIAVRLVGHVQNGKELSEELVPIPGPVADINGLDANQRSSDYLSVAQPSTQADPFSDPSLPNEDLNRPPLPHALSNLPPLTEQDRNKFMQIFHRSGPENGVLSGPRGREVLMKSRLPLSTLGDIWDLADTEHRGSLDAPAFTVAMYLVQACMSGQLTTIPPVLPQQVYAEAGKNAPHAVLDAHYGSSGQASDTPSPVTAMFGQSDTSSGRPPTQFPPSTAAEEPSLIDLDEGISDYSGPMTMPVPAIGGAPLQSARASPPSPPGLNIPSLSVSMSPLSPTSTSISRPFSSPSGTPPLTGSAPYTPLPAFQAAPEGWNWDVTPADKTNSDKHFEALDPWRQGYVEGEAAVGFMSKSKLPPPILAKIWDLADMNHDGKLTREEFAVAMFLIRSKLAGKEVPDRLPPSLVPPPNLPALSDALSAPPPPQASASPVAALPDEHDRSSTPPPSYDESLTATPDIA